MCAWVVAAPRRALEFVTLCNPSIKYSDIKPTWDIYVYVFLALPPCDQMPLDKSATLELC